MNINQMKSDQPQFDVEALKDRLRYVDNDFITRMEQQARMVGISESDIRQGRLFLQDLLR